MAESQRARRRRRPARSRRRQEGRDQEASPAKKRRARRSDASRSRAAPRAERRPEPQRARQGRRRSPRRRRGSSRELDRQGGRGRHRSASGPTTAGRSQVEVARAASDPDTTDVLALYEVDVDADGEPRGLPPRCGATSAARQARTDDDRAASAGPDVAALRRARVGPDGRPQPANLADILERVLDKGIIIAGDIRVNLLDIELLTIKIRLLIVSVDKAAGDGHRLVAQRPDAEHQRAGPRGREPAAARSASRSSSRGDGRADA